MHPALRHTAHRPFPLPGRPWLFRQTWKDLLFAHWPADTEALRPLVPASVEIDTFGGAAWVGVVPFRMAGIAPRGLPAVPWVSATAELNLRLYVTCRGVPGVWFLSLDAANPLAVWVARRFFHLPYYRADMNARREGEAVVYRSARRRSDRSDTSTAPVALEATYRPTSGVFHSTPGTLEHFLTERYCLFTTAPAAGEPVGSPRGRVLRGDIHHAPWPLQRAAAEVAVNTVASAQGVAVEGEPHLLFSRSLKVALWPLTDAGE